MCVSYTASELLKNQSFSPPGSISSASSQSSGFSEASAATSSGSSGQKDYGGLDFKIVVDFKNGSQATIHLVAPSMQEKAAWTSDISQVRPTLKVTTKPSCEQRGDPACSSTRMLIPRKCRLAGEGEEKYPIKSRIPCK
ncbi:hypothetical protein TNCT_656271 [Trichonephila clavata]|uniref:PH domain-containing protein n=1 Tax=Trichonephila clavata TaxID=2740835 RepID=A0A8X6LNT6_TRICU|nr:hypothetical protein TNCT_656271 [Trichonephila clavata]